MADQELVVKFKGDTRDIDAAFSRILGQLNNIQTTANQTSRNVGNLGNSFGSLNNSVGSLVKGFLSISAAMAAGKMFIDATAKVQKFENQLKVASGTQEQYAKNTAFLDNLSEKYNKNVLDLGANFAKLSIAVKGTNLEGKETERLFAAVTATSSALQMSVDDTNGTFNAFIQMVSKGNVQAEELRGQLGERLYGAFNLAAKSMGVTTQELNEMLQRGEVLASDLLPKLTRELESSFGEQAVANAQNLGSAIEYTSGQLTLLLAEAGKSTGLTDLFTDATSAVGKFARELRTSGFFDFIGMTFGAVKNSILTGQNLALSAYGEGAKYAAGKRSGLPSGGKEGVQSTVATDQYGAQYGIHDTNKKAEAQIARANKATASKAATEINRWVSEQIQASKDRIAEGLLDNEIANEAAFRTNNSNINAPGYIGKTGLNNNFNWEGENMGQTFANGVTGGGSAGNYDHIIAGMDGAIKKAQQQYGLMTSATDDFGNQFNSSMQNAFAGAIDSSLEGMGQLIGGFINGTAGWEDVGNFFLNIVVTIFENIGKALSAYAATLIAAKAAFKTASIPGALIGAALAFGGAAIAKAAIGSAGEQAFWTGGIVQGRGGVDNVPARLTAGEMVLNSSQQSRLFGIATGAYSGREFGGSFGSNSGNEDIAVSVYGRLKGTDIDISGSKGKRKNNYFR